LNSFFVNVVDNPAKVEELKNKAAVLESEVAGLGEGRDIACKMTFLGPPKGYSSKISGYPAGSVITINKFGLEGGRKSKVVKFGRIGTGEQMDIGFDEAEKRIEANHFKIQVERDGYYIVD